MPLTTGHKVAVSETLFGISTCQPAWMEDELQQLFDDMKLHARGASVVLPPALTTFEAKATCSPVLAQCLDLGVVAAVGVVGPALGRGRCRRRPPLWRRGRERHGYARVARSAARAVVGRRGRSQVPPSATSSCSSASAHAVSRSGGRCTSTIASMSARSPSTKRVR